MPKLDPTVLEQISSWFSIQGWSPFKFQEQVWRAYLRGESGLIHAPTGMGKTYAAWLGPVIEALAENLPQVKKAPPLRVLWITPLRALAASTESALQAPLQDLGLHWSVERRTGDISSAARSRQQRRLPTALVTTPESLSLLLTRPNAAEIFADLRAVVVDEWHELLGNKRGVQVELGLARLRRWRPSLRTWGLSATIQNTEEALDVLLGSARGNAKLIRGAQPKRIVLDAALPDEVERFPWAGHLGARMAASVIEAIEAHRTTLLFTNTRSQAEQWYQLLISLRPEWEGSLGLHHGSIQGDERERVEQGLATGTMRAVVCTSSLDLGVDFAPVERVLQLGSPKGVARLLQRAGRSGHQPGATSRATCIPTNALELIEAAAVREAAQANNIEPRTPLTQPVDVLVQHVVTIAAGGGFEAAELFEEVRTTHAYSDLAREDFDWVLEFVTVGGRSLRGHPEYHRVTQEGDRYLVKRPEVATRHRLNIGTITSDASLQVRFAGGNVLGSVEENFLAKLRPGDTFVFAGRVLQLERVREMTALVRRSSSKKPAIPRWMGGRMPLSTQLADAMRKKIDEAAKGQYLGAEMEAVRPVLELQAAWSALPQHGELLLERFKTREGHHLVIFPFAGRLVHEGLSALCAFRLARIKPQSFAFTSNDYGFELVSTEPPELEAALEEGLFSTEQLLADIEGSLNLAELARRQFRQIARVSGLIFQAGPWARKTVRQFQASSGLFYDVFAKYEPDNLLLRQAKQEMLEEQFEHTRLRETLLRMNTMELLLMHPEHPTPLAFPLIVDSMRARLSSEKAADRIQKMRVRLERVAPKLPEKEKKKA